MQIVQLVRQRPFQLFEAVTRCLRLVIGTHAYVALRLAFPV